MNSYFKSKIWQLPLASIIGRYTVIMSSLLKKFLIFLAIVVVLGVLYLGATFILIFNVGGISTWLETNRHQKELAENQKIKEQILDEILCDELRVQHVYHPTKYLSPGGLFNYTGLLIVDYPETYHKLRIINSNDVEATIAIGPFGNFFRSSNENIYISEIYGKRASKVHDDVFSEFEEKYLIEIGSGQDSYPSGFDTEYYLGTPEKRAVHASEDVVLIGIKSEFLTLYNFSQLSNCENFKSFVLNTFKYDPNPYIFFYPMQ